MERERVLRVYKNSTQHMIADKRLREIAAAADYVAKKARQKQERQAFYLILVLWVFTIVCFW